VQDAHHVEITERRCESVKRRILTLTLAAVMAVSMLSTVGGTAFAKNGADDPAGDLHGRAAEGQLINHK